MSLIHINHIIAWIKQRKPTTSQFKMLCIYNIKPGAEGKLLSGGLLWWWGDSAAVGSGWACSAVSRSQSGVPVVDRAVQNLQPCMKWQKWILFEPSDNVPIQSKPEDWKMMPNFETNNDHTTFLGPSPATKKEKPNLLVEVQTKSTMAWKQWQGNLENIDR